MPTIRQVWQLIQQGDYAFSVDLKGADLHIPIVKHHHSFLHFVWQPIPYQWKLLPFGQAMASRVFTSLKNPYCSFAIARVFILSFMWMISWTILAPSVLAKELKPYVLYCFFLDYVLNFPSLNSVSISFLGGCVGIHWTCMSLYPLTNFVRSSSWFILCYRGNPLQSYQVMSFLGKTTLCDNGHVQLC